LKAIQAFLLRYKIYLLHLLAPLGFWGVGAIAIIDSSSLPVPMDFLIAGYVWHDKSHFYLYCLLAAVGSAIGGLVPFYLGRAGGEIFLLKRIDRARYEQMRDRFEKQEFLAMMIPSMMPPPTPWKAFVFAAGVFEMKVTDFVGAVFAGRLIRYLVTALLTIRYGPRIVEVVGELAHKHLDAMLIGLGAILAALAIVMLRKSLGRKKTVAEVPEAPSNSGTLVK